MDMIQLGFKNLSRRKGKRMDRTEMIERGRRPGGLVVDQEKPINRLIASQVLGLLETLTLKTIREWPTERSRFSLDFLSHGET